MSSNGTNAPPDIGIELHKLCERFGKRLHGLGPAHPVDLASVLAPMITVSIGSEIRQGSLACCCLRMDPCVDVRILVIISTAYPA